MLNQVVIVGRMVDEAKDSDNVYITLSVSNEVTSDYEESLVAIRIPISLYPDSFKDSGFSHKDLIGIKGMVHTGNIIIAKKVTYLSKRV